MTSWKLIPRVVHDGTIVECVATPRPRGNPSDETLLARPAGHAVQRANAIRVYVAYRCSAQSLYESHGKAIDPSMTLVGCFNSMRELGGMRRLVDHDIVSRSRKHDRRGCQSEALSESSILHERIQLLTIFTFNNCLIMPPGCRGYFATH